MVETSPDHPRVTVCPYSVLFSRPRRIPRAMAVTNMAVVDVSRKEAGEVSFSSWCHRPSGACDALAAAACCLKMVLTRVLAAASGYPSGYASIDSRASACPSMPQPLARDHLQHETWPSASLYPWKLSPSTGSRSRRANPICCRDTSSANLGTLKRAAIRATSTVPMVWSSPHTNDPVGELFSLGHDPPTRRAKVPSARRCGHPRI
mmetsp:Transcript_3153/g.7621  ORF Transcript_3153/g.7621 Transcript_3153/m.7621 type:complete len:206 (+) Transcript_3153:284-901(+)